MKAKKLAVGDQVEWNTAQGKTVGHVQKELTAPMKIKSHQVKASPANPELLVKTDKSKKLAAHKPSELKKIAGKKKA